MKIYLTFLFLVGVHGLLNGQTNTFPNSGPVGIGTTSPTYTHHVVNSGTGSTTVASVNTNPDSYSRFLIMNDKGAGSYADLIQYSSLGGYTLFGHNVANRIMLYSDGMYSEGMTLGTLTAKPLILGTYNSERMRIDQQGNVGLGTSTPLDKLHMSGADLGLLMQGSIRSQLKLTTTNQNGWQIELSDANGNQSAGDLGFTEAGVSAGRLVIKKGGNVLIGKTTQANTAYKLDISGAARANEITVNTTGADFVFDEGYRLRSLAETEAFIKQNKHLPEIAPATEMVRNGISLGGMNAKLLQKIEELTLHLIEQNKRQESLVNEVKYLKSKINQLSFKYK